MDRCPGLCLRRIEQALGAGATLDEVMADGVETDHGLLDWRSIRDAERGFVEVTDLLCD